MNADNELIQAIGQMMDTKLAAALEPINNRLDCMDKRLDTMQADIADLKEDVRKIDETTVSIEVEHGRKISGLYDSVVGTGEKFTRLDTVENKVANHDHRIWALEQAVKEA